jgi:hypothetical protein
MVVGSMLQSMPGLTMPADQGRPRVADVVGHWGALIPRHAVTATVAVDGTIESISSAVPEGHTSTYVAEEANLAIVPAGGETVTVPLVQLCLARSGDKGDTANVGVAARSPEVYTWLVQHLTGDVVKQHFKGVVNGEVDVHPLPNLLAVNYLLHESLGGGGTSSLQFDAQGKTYAQYLLSLEVAVPIDLLATV